MAEYWLVSVPGDPTPRQSWEFMNEKTNSISSNYKFNIPDLKVLTYYYYVEPAGQGVVFDST